MPTEDTKLIDKVSDDLVKRNPDAYEPKSEDEILKMSEKERDRRIRAKIGAMINRSFSGKHPTDQKDAEQTNGSKSQRRREILKETYRWNSAYFWPEHESRPVTEWTKDFVDPCFDSDKLTREERLDAILDEYSKTDYIEILKDGFCDFRGILPDRFQKKPDYFPGHFPYFTILLTLSHVAVFIYFYTQDAPARQTIEKFNKHTKCTPLIVSPFHQHEPWRFFLYQFNHAGIAHLVSNMIVQTTLGCLLEVIHGAWRVATLFFAGVLFGALFALWVDPSLFLVGASGNYIELGVHLTLKSGDYALIMAYVANIAMNFDTMKPLYGGIRIGLVLLWLGLDTGILIDRMVSGGRSPTSWAAHMGGSLAGLFLGCAVLWNPEKKPFEKIFKWVGLGLYITCTIAIIIVMIVGEEMKSKRAQGIPCIYFKTCTKLNPDFACNSTLPY